MELPNLLNKLKPKPEEVKQFLAVEISLDTVKSAVWQVEGNHTTILSLGSIEACQQQTPDSLLLAVDATLSQALAGQNPNINEIIFGFSEAWVDQDGIATEHKETIKHLCKKLNLKPVGFVVTTEALVSHLHNTEGGAPSAILLNLAQSEVIVTLVKLGHLQGSHTVGRSQDLGSDVEEGLARFPTTDNLPSRIILFDGHLDLEDAKQTLLSYDWQAKLPFLHFPKIEILPKDYTINAIAITGGSEVAKSLGILAHQVTVNQPNAPLSPPAPKPIAPPSHSPIKVTPEDVDFGFSKVAESTLPKPAGISFDDTLKEPDEPLELESAQNPSQDLPDQDSPEPPPSKRPSLPAFKLPQLKISLPHIGIPPLLTIGALIFFLLILSAFIAYWHFPKATLTLYLTPRSITKEVTFIVDPTITALDVQNNRLPGNQQTVEVSGEKEQTTTGSKIVGERAAGTVTIFNRTTAQKTFPAGTVISTNNLRYSLDQDVTIASASTKENADFSITTNPSQKDAQATAVAIGADYNIAADTQLTVANFSSDSYIAKVKTEFTGGSSREIQAVDEADQETLKTALLQELQAKVGEKATFRADGEQGIVTSGEPEITSESFSAEIGDEVKSLSLSLTLNQAIYVYDKADITLLTQQLVAQDIPQNFELQPQGTKVNMTSTQLNQDNTITATAAVDLKLLPKLDPTDIAKNLTGKYPEVTQNYLQSLPNFSRIETQFTPTLPAKINTYPRRTDHITVIIKSTE